MIVRKYPRLRVLAMAIVSSIAALPVFAAEEATFSHGPEASALTDGLIVAYRPGSTKQRDRSTLMASLSTVAGTAFGRSGLTLRHERTLSTGGELVTLSRKLDHVETEALMRQIAADTDVLYVEPNSRLYPNYVPNDPLYPTQYALGIGAGRINWRPAMDTGYRGQGKIIAVVDTGRINHSDLNAKWLGGYDFISNAFVSRDGGGRDPNPQDQGDWNPVAGECYPGSPVRPSSWHGAHVAGIAAAVTNNAVGIAGTAPNARIVPVRVLGRCGGSLADIADAVRWAAGGAVAGVPANPFKAHVINMSLGGSGACPASMQAAINYAVSNGVAVVVAAGNSNANVAGFMPANCANVITVASTTSTCAKSGFSNWGPLVDLAAPGSSIRSTVNPGATVPVAGDAYAYYNGTSMAAPHVAGAVADKQSAPAADLSPALMESRLKATARACTPAAPYIGRLLNLDLLLRTAP